MTNFNTGWGTILSSPPQLFYAHTLGFLSGGSDAVPSVIPGADSLPARPDGYELVRVVVYGSSYGINYTIRWLYRLNFAQVSEWSFPMPVPGSGEMMSIVTKRIPSDRIT
jgi:hypothetical protein